MVIQQHASVLWLLSNHVQNAFEQGINAKENEPNPFEPYSNEWFSWNRGYNEMMLSINNTTKQQQ